MVRFIRYGKLFRLYEHLQPFLKYSLPLEEKLKGDKVLVIAPHPDDEAIGCGGAIARHSKSGGTVDVVYCTMDDVRRKEAAAAAKALGIKNIHELGFEVESLVRQKELPERLENIIASVKPEFIFVPFWFDDHTDHRAVNEALIKISRRIDPDIIMYAYPIWLPLYPNVLIDIGDQWEIKKKAIECYSSQMATRDYVTMSRTLGQYWATVKGRGLQVVESFFRASSKEYTSLGGKILHGVSCSADKING